MSYTIPPEILRKVEAIRARPNPNKNVTPFTPLEQIIPRWKDHKEYMLDAWFTLTEGQRKAVESFIRYEYEDENGNVQEIIVPEANIIHDYMLKKFAIEHDYEFFQLAEKIRNLDWIECRCEEGEGEWKGFFYMWIPCPVCCKVVKYSDPIGIDGMHKTYEGQKVSFSCFNCRNGKETSLLPFWYKRINKDKVLVKFLEWHLLWKHKDL
jgi:hypothetical protein